QVVHNSTEMVPQRIDAANKLAQRIDAAAAAVTAVNQNSVKVSEAIQRNNSAPELVQNGDSAFWKRINAAHTALQLIDAATTAEDQSSAKSSGINQQSYDVAEAVYHDYAAAPRHGTGARAAPGRGCGTYEPDKEGTSVSPAEYAARRGDELEYEEAYAEPMELPGYKDVPAAVAAAARGDEARLPADVLDTTSECELDSTISSRVLSSSDDPGKYTDYDEDMFNFTYYGIPLP